MTETKSQPQTITYDEINAGDRALVVSRGYLGAIVVGKFRSKEDGSIDPAGTEFVELRSTNGVTFFAYPSQLVRYESPKAADPSVEGSVAQQLATHAESLAAFTSSTDLSPAERVRAAKLDMVRQVRTILTNDAREDAGLGMGRLADAALNTSIETMMGWVLPNESLMSNVNTVLAMVRQTNNPTDPFAGIPGAHNEEE